MWDTHHNTLLQKFIMEAAKIQTKLIRGVRKMVNIEMGLTNPIQSRIKYKLLDIANHRNYTTNSHTHTYSTSTHKNVLGIKMLTHGSRLDFFIPTLTFSAFSWYF